MIQTLSFLVLSNGNWQKNFIVPYPALPYCRHLENPFDWGCERKVNRRVDNQAYEVIC